MWPRARTATAYTIHTQYMNFRRACHWDIKYRKGPRRSVDHRTEHYESNDTYHQLERIIAQFSRRDHHQIARVTATASVRYSCWTERSVRREITHSLQGQWRHSSITLAHPVASDRKRSSARRTLSFYNLWDSRCATFEMIDILNITVSRSLMIASSRLRLTYTTHSPTQRWSTAMR